MKLAILTLRLLDNYGGLLQAFALQRTLENMGHSAAVFDAPKIFSVPCGKKTVTYGKRIILKLMGRDIEIFREKRRTREYAVVNQNITRFLNENINRLEVCDFEALSPEELDGIIVGSDQVWRPKYCWGGKLERGFLDFAEDWSIKRIAYAASFGTDKWELTRGQTKRCASLLRKFDKVSVRESSGIGLCRDRLGRGDAVQTLDPTLLLDAEVYRGLVQRHPADSEPAGLMVYILDEKAKKTELVSRISAALGLDPFRSGVKIRGPIKPIQERIYPAVEQWLGDFIRAEFVVTDSFHGCIFSILFRKPFAVYGNKSRGYERFTSLLGMLGLEDRFIFEDMTERQIKELASRPIDFDRVHAVLQAKRKESLMYLENALGAEK